jgi:hypothetical protein
VYGPSGPLVGLLMIDAHKLGRATGLVSFFFFFFF